jgi:hypothetical protein
MTETPCEYCPAAAAGLRCPRWPTNHTTYCDWANPHRPGHNPFFSESIVRIARVQSGELAPPAPSPLALPEPPGIITRAVTFARAAAAHLYAGRPLVSQDAASARLAICEGCEMYRPDVQDCRLCGCNMPLKVTWADQECPIEKWSAVE